ncbi:MAG: RNA 2',3'-cyclic phosphodiesterase [Candidatus Bipolaricaulota bacterium]
MRLFFCVELPEDVRRLLTERSRELRRKLGTAKWVTPENMHITLRFLGELGEDTAREIQDMAAELAKEAEPFQVELETLGAFPRAERARVLWVGPAARHERFARLAHGLEEAVQAAGLPPERREASPHVTLARFRSPRNVAQVIAPLPEGPLAVPVEELVLMSSVLGPQGPTYSPVARLPLKG